METIVKDLHNPMRIDAYIVENLSSFSFSEKERGILSRSKIQSMLKSGDILCNGEKVKKNLKVLNGDIISISITEREETNIVPEDIAIDIVYEDEDVIVVNKKRGMVVHPAIGNYSGTLVNALLYHINQEKNQEAKDFFDKNLNIEHSKIRPGIVHRIDKDTTGLLMIAKNDYAHIHLSKQLKERTVNRKYLALVLGGFQEEEGVVDAPIKRHRKDRLKMAVDMAGKNARTNYKVLERFGNYTLLELRLDTGRTHQIRVHMKYIKHPVVGDPLYGSKNCKYRHIGQLLHAKTLGFIHPTSGEYLEFEAELPEDFQEVLQKEKR